MQEEIQVNILKSLQATASSEYLQARMGVKVTLVDLSCLIMMADGN